MNEQIVREAFEDELQKIAINLDDEGKNEEEYERKLEAFKKNVIGDTITPTGGETARILGKGLFYAAPGAGLGYVGGAALGKGIASLGSLIASAILKRKISAPTHIGADYGSHVGAVLGGLGGLGLGVKSSVENIKDDLAIQHLRTKGIY